MKRYLALDMGAESGRLMAVSIDDQISTQEIHRFLTPVKTDSKNRRCWDFPKIIEEVITALSKASTSGSYEALAVDTWGLDFGLIDKDGAIIELPVSHRDHRTDGMLAEAEKLVGKKRLHFESGCQLLEVNSIYQLLSIPLHIFTKVEDPGTIRGELKKEIQDKTGIGPIKCIATTSHDTASAVFATPLISPGSAYISSGTWSLLGVELMQPVVNEITMNERLTNEGGFNRSIRLLRNIMGLWLIQEVRRDLRASGVELTYAQLVEQAKQVADPFATLIFVDASLFIHAGGMIERIQRFAKNTNQKIPTTPGEIAQTVFASLALQYAKTCDSLALLSNLPMPAIHIVGGGSQNEHLCQLTADISGRQVIAGPVEATALGNAMVSAIATGAHTDLTDTISARALIEKSNLGLKQYLPSQGRDTNTIAQVRTSYEVLTQEDMR